MRHFLGLRTQRYSRSQRRRGEPPEKVCLAVRVAVAYDSGMALDRIAVDHQIMGGVPCVRGTRIPVATVVGLVAQGLTNAEIRVDYPELADEDIRASLEFAAEAVPSDSCRYASRREVPDRRVREPACVRPVGASWP
jgi:uncharacterized protein (DUF433 family)